MRERNLLIKVYDIAFYAHGNEPWWHCHLFVNNAAVRTQPDPEIGGWDRNLSGRLYPSKSSANSRCRKDSPSTWRSWCGSKSRRPGKPS